MPRIPLYNQGQGSAVRLQAGQLSRRADVGAFTAPGKALASLGGTVSDIAFQFGMAEKRAETDRVYNEALTQYGAQADEMAINPASRTVRGFEIESGEFRRKALDDINGRADLTKSQKAEISSKIGRMIDRKVSVGRGRVFDKQQTERTAIMNQGIAALISDASDKTMREEVMGDIGALIETSKQQGLKISYNMQSIGYEIDRKDFLADTANTSVDEQGNPVRGIEYFESMLKDAQTGQGKYSTYSSTQQEKAVSDIESHLRYLRTDVKSQAADDLKAATSAIILTGDDQGFGQKAVNGLRLAGDESAANEAEISLEAATGAYSFSRSVAFDSPAQIEDKMKFQSEVAKQLAATDPIRAEANLKATTDAMAIRRESIQKDPASYVIRAFQEIHNTPPTRKQILEKQRQMGIADENISLLTGTEVQEISGQIAQSETPAEITEILSAAAGTGETASFIMKQLNASGLSLAINYVGNKPDSPLASKLLQSARPESITITRPAAKYQQLGGFVRNNEIVKSHLKSLSGGSYADFSDNSIIGAATDTSSQNKVRQDHIKMIQEFALFLIQEDGLQLTGPDGVSISDEEMKSYVDAAAQVINERYTYIESFPNPQTSLRLPKQYENPQIIKSISAALSNEARNLFEKDIFFENNTYSEEDREFGMLKTVYYENVKSGYGWIMGADGRTAFMVDNAGGLVFRKGLDGGPVPVSMDIEIAAQFTPTKKPDVTITAEDVEAF
jgi:hypothetical protein